MRLPRIFQDASFDTFEVTDGNRRAFELARAVVEKAKNGERPKGVIFVGPQGVGKSHLCAAIINGLRPLFRAKVVDNGAVIEQVDLDDFYEWWLAPELLAVAKDSFKGRGEDPFPRAKSVKVLVLDDLGKEKLTDWVEEQFFSLVDHRWREQKLTLMTTNLDQKGLLKRYGANGAPWFLSRLHGMGDFVRIDGEDWRLR